MKKIIFKSAGVANAQKFVNSAKSTTSSVKSGVDSVRKNMQTEVAARSNISTRLNNIKSSLSTIETNLGAIYKTVESATTKYVTNEADLIRLGKDAAAGKKLTTKSSINQGAFAPIKAGKGSVIKALKKSFNDKSALLSPQEAAKIKWGSKNNITQKYNPTSKYFDIPLDNKYKPKKYDLSESIFVSKGLIDPILHPSPYKGRFNNTNPKLTPSTSNALGVKAESTTTAATKDNTTPKESGWFNTVDTFLKFTGPFGILGNAVNTTGIWINAIANGDETDNGQGLECAKAAVNTVDNSFKAIADLAENAYRAADKQNKGIFFGDWNTNAVEKLAKATDDYKDVTSSKWGASALQELNENWKPDKLKTVGENTKVVANWTGVALDGITNAIDNYTEFKDDGGLSNGRMWAETVGETAVDTAIDIAATSAAGVIVGAAATAVGAASAPVAVVGIVAVGIVWGANAITEVVTEKITGEKKDIAELVVDTVLDAPKVVADLGEKVVNVTSDFIGNIGAKWKECWG